MKLKRAIAASVLVSAFAAPVAAGTFEDAVDAHARGDYAKALRLIRPLANDGDASAQFNLGLMYTTGQGVQQDNAAAALWFRKAAEQGYAPAQSYAYDGDRLVLRGGLSTHKHVFKSELKSG